MTKTQQLLVRKLITERADYILALGSAASPAQAAERRELLGAYRAMCVDVQPGAGTGQPTNPPEPKHEASQEQVPSCDGLALAVGIALFSGV